MTHPIETAMTEAITMAKLMRENERLARELAEERALCDRLGNSISAYFQQHDRRMITGTDIHSEWRVWLGKRGEG